MLSKARAVDRALSCELEGQIVESLALVEEVAKERGWRRAEQCVTSIDGECVGPLDQRCWQLAPSQTFEGDRVGLVAGVLHGPVRGRLVDHRPIDLDRPESRHEVTLWLSIMSPPPPNAYNYHVDRAPCSSAAKEPSSRPNMYVVPARGAFRRALPPWSPHRTCQRESIEPLVRVRDERRLEERTLVRHGVIGLRPALSVSRTSAAVTSRSCWPGAARASRDAGW